MMTSVAKQHVLQGYSAWVMCHEWRRYLILQSVLFSQSTVKGNLRETVPMSYKPSR